MSPGECADLTDLVPKVLSVCVCGGASVAHDTARFSRFLVLLELSDRANQIKAESAAVRAKLNAQNYTPGDEGSRS